MTDDATLAEAELAAGFAALCGYDFDALPDDSDDVWETTKADFLRWARERRQSAELWRQSAGVS